MKLPIAILLFSTLLTTYGEEAVKSVSLDEINVGGRVIKLPAPSGFERVDGLDVEKDRLIDSMLPASNRYLARFDKTKFNTADEGRNFNAQVLRTIESREIGDRTFSDMKQETKSELEKAQETLRQEMAKITGKAQKALQDATEADAALSVSDVAVLGCFDDSPSSLGFTMALNLAAKAGEKSIKSKLVAAGMIVPINGRLIYLYANADLNSEADRKWAEQAVTAWRDSVVAANPRVEGPAGSFSLFNGVGRSTVIGAIVGGLGALLALLFKKKKV